MQPTADATNYMLKTDFATNGQPGIVDHAVLANLANTVVWSTITDLPAVFPPAIHGIQHLQNGDDPIPLATTALDGLMPAGNNDPNSYVGGDVQWHALPGLVYFRSEVQATLDAAFTAGATLASAMIPNPAQGVYVVDEGFLYSFNPSYPPAGMVHFDVYDYSIPGWVSVTDSTEISSMTTSTGLLRPILASSAMTRTWTAPANRMQWRLVLDQASGQPAYFQCGMAFFVTQLTALVKYGP
jgi:hypothetical protein